MGHSPNAEYWRARSLLLGEKAARSGVEYARSAGKEFEKVSRRIQIQIDGWYQRFARNNKISLVEAKRLLNSHELEEFRWTVEDYIKAGEGCDPKWARALENASARVHISRLESLLVQLQQEVEVLYGNHMDGLDRILKRIYSEAYYHMAYEVQHGFRLGWYLHSLDERQIRRVLSAPWTTDGQTFKDRCWKQKGALIQELKTDMTQALICGDPPIRTAEKIARRFQAAKSKAGRLAVTESAYFNAVAQSDCYGELGVEQFQVIESLDFSTCKICQELDGKVLPMSEYEPGVTAPPFHPNCRGCTAPYFDDNNGMRAARGISRKVYHVPGSMTYPEWKAAFVDKESGNAE